MSFGRSLLVLEPSAWARSCISRLRQRGDRAELASDWKAARQLLRMSRYDLILVDEPVWRADPGAVRQLIQEGGRVAVLATKFTPEGHLFFAQAGAKGYLDKSLSPDSLLLEIERVFAAVGLVPTRGRILVADNDPEVRSALKGRLAIEGWAVEVAKDPEDALEKIRSGRPHVVVLDIRMRDDENWLDESGFELARKIREYGSVIKLVGLTGSPTRNTAPHTAGILDAFVLKENSDDLPREIAKVYGQLGINTVLEIEYEHPIDLPSLVRMIRDYQDRPEDEQKKIALEVEEILRKLFPNMLKVIVYHLSPRRGGSGIALVRPLVANRLGRPLVVKFGPRPRMEAEVKKYREHVQPVLEDPLTFLDGQQPAETLNLGGLKFDLAGMTAEKPRTFNDFYRDRGVSAADVADALEHLFKVTCKGWYDNPESFYAASPGDLFEAYETHILERLTQKSVALAGVSRLLQDTWVPGISFASIRQDDLLVSLQGRELILPNPCKLLEPLRAAEFLPQPVSKCRTHGNLHGLNMFLDRSHKIWLIDFYLTGWGPMLLDFVQLECAIKFELVEQNDLRALYELDKALLRPSESREMPEPGQRPWSDDLKKALSTISTLRRLANELVEPDLREYYLGLLLHGLRTAAWESREPKERNRQAVRQSHALLSAGLAAYRLCNWGERWRGWPDESTAITPG